MCWYVPVLCALLWLYLSSLPTVPVPRLPPSLISLVVSSDNLESRLVTEWMKYTERRRKYMRKDSTYLLYFVSGGSCSQRSLLVLHYWWIAGNLSQRWMSDEMQLKEQLLSSRDEYYMMDCIVNCALYIYYGPSIRFCMLPSHAFFESREWIWLVCLFHKIFQ